MSAKSILFVVTSHGKLGKTGEATGLWLEELAAPYYAFIDAGYHVDIVSIAGGPVPIDPRSRADLGQNPPSVERFLADPEAMEAIEDSRSVGNVNGTIYAAVFLPGGHGTMWDLPDSHPLAELIAETYESGRVVAAVCHGPAGLVNVRLSNGDPLVKGREVSAFTDSEEAAVGLTKAVPFLLESKLAELGAIIRSGPDFEPFAVVDENLVTGQNPPSSEKVAQLVMGVLEG